MKKLKQKKLVVGILIFCLVIMYQISPIQNALAVSLTDAKDTISDSDLSSTGVTHTFAFTTSTSTPIGDYFSIVFDDDFVMTSATSTCPVNMTASSSGQVFECYATSLIAAGAQTGFVVTNVTNPGVDGSQLNIIYHKTAAGVTKEYAQVMTYIISDVTMTATVNATLKFTIEGLNAGDTVNSVAITATSTATTTPFGTLSIVASSTVGQRLKVATNADDGYVVSVWEDDELSSDSGSDINSFSNALTGTGSSTLAVPWQAPTNILDETNTYGHMGLTSDDTAITGGLDFSGSKYAGFTGTSSIPVMSHDGVCDEVTVGKCVNKVAYTAEITALQEAGDYTNTLTYVATAQY
jgi:hypothetical protein